ncbi:MAG TPA: hypothetical protein VGH45_11765 [Solirubrobacteraceae bacterium]
MRRYLFAVLTSLALLAVLPAGSMAGSHHRSHERGERHHRRHDRIEHFRAHHRVAGHQMPQDIGTVQSFQNQILKLTLNDGSVVSGRFSRATRVECLAMDHGFRRDDGGPGPSGGSGDDRNGGDNGDRGDNPSAQGGHDAGDDRGDDNNRANEDNDNDANDDNDADDANDNQDNANCLMALQTPGTHVRDATLKLTSGGAFWQRIDLDS